MSLREAAYAEPIAAALAVLKADIHPHQEGIVYGGNRIARLTARLLAAHGFTRVRIHDPAGPEPLEPDGAEFAVETVPSAPALVEMIRAVRPGGLVVLKSRPPAPVPIDLTAAVRRELRFQAVSYAPFADAIRVLAERRVVLDDLLGPIRPLAEFPSLAARPIEDETSKTFLSLEVSDVRDPRTAVA